MSNVGESVAVYFMFTMMALLLVSGVMGYCMGLDDPSAPTNRDPNAPSWVDWAKAFVMPKDEENDGAENAADQVDDGSPVEIKVSQSTSLDSGDEVKGTASKSPLPPSRPSDEAVGVEASEKSSDKPPKAPAPRPSKTGTSSTSSISKGDGKPPKRADGTSLDRPNKPTPRASKTGARPPPRSRGTSPASSEQGSEKDSTRGYLDRTGQTTAGEVEGSAPQATENGEEVGLV